MEYNTPRALRTIERRLRLAQLVLAWEKLWRALWPATATIMAFGAITLWGGFELLPGWAHLALLVAFGLGFIWVLWRPASHMAWPSDKESRRRIQLTNGVNHRPLETLSDGLPRPQGHDSLKLWEAHQRRALEIARHLKVRWPRAGLAARDPHGFRVALALLVLTGVIAAGDNWQQRVAYALTPDLQTGKANPAELAAWIVPPGYTGAPPVFLTPPPGQDPAGFIPPSAPGELIQVPAGAEYFARINGGRGVPELVSPPNNNLPFAIVDSENYQITTTIEESASFSVTQGHRELGAWTITVIEDLPPQIAYALPVMVTPRMGLQVRYSAEDDYGLASIRLRIRRLDTGAEELFEIALPGIHPRQVENLRVFDLTPHPWAGLAVALTLEAEDGISQIGKAEEIRMHLPEREFANPMARAIVEQRRNLVVHPEHWANVRDALDGISKKHAQEIGDFGIFLSLRSTVSRLTYDHSIEVIPEIVEHLWTVALALEDGGFSIAERELRDAQQALQDALDRNASDSEIEELIEQVRKAMEKYLTALAERSSDNEGEPFQVDPDVPTMSARDLMEMLDRAQDLNRLGAREAAEQLISELQKMMENLRPGRTQESQGIADQALEEINEVIQQQQQLLDQTFQQEQRGAFGDPTQLPQPGQQRSLGQRLEQMTEGLGQMLGEVPQAFGTAAEAMENAAQALQESQAGPALQQQTEALNQLRQGAAQLLEQMIEQILGESGNNPGGNQLRENPQPNVDPLGRPMRSMGANINNELQVPDIDDLQRAREIMEELFRRAGERTRPLLELEYLERLLRRF